MKVIRVKAIDLVMNNAYVVFKEKMTESVQLLFHLKNSGQYQLIFEKIK